MEEAASATTYGVVVLSCVCAVLTLVVLSDSVLIANSLHMLAFNLHLTQKPPAAHLLHHAGAKGNVLKVHMHSHQAKRFHTNGQSRSKPNLMPRPSYYQPRPSVLTLSEVDAEFDATPQPNYGDTGHFARRPPQPKRIIVSS